MIGFPFWTTDLVFWGLSKLYILIRGATFNICEGTFKTGHLTEKTLPKRKSWTHLQPIYEINSFSVHQVGEPEEHGPAGLKQPKTSAASGWWRFILSGLWDTLSPTGTDWSGLGKCWAAQLSFMKNGGPERWTEIAAKEARARKRESGTCCLSGLFWCLWLADAPSIITDCSNADPPTRWTQNSRDRQAVRGLEVQSYGGWRCWTETLIRSAPDCERGWFTPD